MEEAWSNPTYLKRLLSNPGPLLLYDKLYIDAKSYENYCASLDDVDRRFVQSFVEDVDLDIFQLVLIEQPFLESVGDTFNNDFDFVHDGFNNLYHDSEFISSVDKLKREWGFYAKPAPLKFEAMNIPVTELLCSKWSERVSNLLQIGKKPLSIIDHPERMMLYKVFKQKNSICGRIAPEISLLLVENLPKMFFGMPYEEEWDINKIKTFRDNKDLNQYRKKVDKLSEKVDEIITKYIQDNRKSFPQELKSEADYEILGEVQYSLNQIQTEVTSEAIEYLEELRDSRYHSANAWSVLGGITTGTGVAISHYLPQYALFGYAVDFLGIGMVITPEIINFWKSKKMGWLNFLEYMHIYGRKDTKTKKVEKQRQIDAALSISQNGNN